QTVSSSPGPSDAMATVSNESVSFPKMMFLLRSRLTVTSRTKPGSIESLHSIWSWRTTKPSDSRSATTSTTGRPKTRPWSGSLNAVEATGADDASVTAPRSSRLSHTASAATATMTTAAITDGRTTDRFADEVGGETNSTG